MAKRNLQRKHERTEQQRRKAIEDENASGMKPGKKIGEKLEELLKLVIEDPKLNTKEELLKRLN